MSIRGIIALLAIATAAAVASITVVQPAEATLAGKNARIAYTKQWNTQRQNPRVDIFTVRPNGTGEKRLTTSRDSRRPIWSPMGGRIAYQRAGAVWVMGSDGSAKQRVIRGQLVGWMPGGKRILVVGARLPNQPAGDGDPIWLLVSISTGAAQQLPIDLPLAPGLEPPYENYDEWSYMWGATLAPDGEHIALALARDDYGGDLYSYTFSSFFTVRLDGTDLRRVGLYTYGLGASDWAPNGRQLVYSNREPRADCIDGLHSIRLDGTRGSVDISQPCDENGPAWSPNGRQIAFATSKKLRIASLDGSRIITVLRSTNRHYGELDWRSLPAEHTTGRAVLPTSS